MLQLVVFVLGLSSCLFSLPVKQDGTGQQIKYIICLIYPKSETIDGTIEKEWFDTLFAKDYSLSGERLSPPDERSIVGSLVVSDGKTLIAIPIVHWQTKDNKSVYLCQGTNPAGKAPGYSVRADSRDDLVRMIKKQLSSRQK